jgi:hypothetical protein
MAYVKIMVLDPYHLVYILYNLDGCKYKYKLWSNEYRCMYVIINNNCQMASVLRTKIAPGDNWLVKSIT